MEENAAPLIPQNIHDSQISQNIGSKTPQTNHKNLYLSIAAVALSAAIVLGVLTKVYYLPKPNSTDKKNLPASHKTPAPSPTTTLLEDGTIVPSLNPHNPALRFVGLRYEYEAVIDSIQQENGEEYLMKLKTAPGLPNSIIVNPGLSFVFFVDNDHNLQKAEISDLKPASKVIIGTSYFVKSVPNYFANRTHKENVWRAAYIHIPTASERIGQ